MSCRIDITPDGRRSTAPFEQSRDVAQRHLDLSQVRLEDLREVLKRIEQNFLVLREGRFLLVALKSELLADRFVRHRSFYVGREDNRSGTDP